MAVTWINVDYGELFFDKSIQPIQYLFRLKVKSESLDQRGLVTAVHRGEDFIMKIVTESGVVSMNHAQSLSECLSLQYY